MEVGQEKSIGSAKSIPAMRCKSEITQIPIQHPLAAREDFSTGFDVSSGLFLEVILTCSFSDLVGKSTLDTLPWGLREQSTQLNTQGHKHPKKK